MEVKTVTCQRIGAPMLFDRLWKETSCQKVLADLLESREFIADIERAIFITVLHRIMVQGSDRACHHWMQSYAIPGASTLVLHHFYRAVAWLGEQLPETDQSHATQFSPRCIKDTIEEKLFSNRRDLFSVLSLVFMDTTSLSFHGAGGTMGKRGFSKDHRPDLNQMILAVIIDQNGFPICCEMWPGNTADVTSLLPVVDRLRGRFGVERVVVVADRGMISEATITGLEERGMEYILGVRERTDSRVRKHVLKDTAPLQPFVVHRKQGETQLFGKEVRHEGIRYIVAATKRKPRKIVRTDRPLLRGLSASSGKVARRWLATAVIDATFVR